MQLKQGVVLLLVFGMALARCPVRGEEPIDWEMVNRIRDEGLKRSRVMEILRHLTDDIGPRLTGSPAMVRANEWTRDKLTEWGLVNARLEQWGPFGRGWSFSRTAVHLLRPRAVPLTALPLAWTPGTDGPRRGTALKVKLESEEDFEQHRGEIAGKILFLSDSRPIEPPEQLAFERYSPDQLEELELFDLDAEGEKRDRKKLYERWRFRRALNQFLEQEQVLATVDISSRDGGTLRLGGGGSRQPGESVGVPSLVVAAESYNWILRLLEDGQEVELEIDVATEFFDADLMAYNTLAEIRGGDKGKEIVMLGAHLDSWHPGTGTNDNASGCAVVMEAVRILRALEIRPRRTIRVGLWSGEEQGLLGSRAHVEALYATRPVSDDPEEQDLPVHMRTPQWPISPKPAWSQLAAYFNFDNGGGKIRGIYTQGNAAVGPIFEAWLVPFRDLGADTVTNRDTDGTDHLSFDRVGLPGFQFIQDGLDYMTLTHHSNLDVFDRARREDLMQAAVVMASFAYHAAMRDEMLPRKPMPQEPAPGEEPEED